MNLEYVEIQSSFLARSIPRIDGNAGTHGNDGKFHKSHHVINSKKKVFRGFPVFE